MVGLLRMNASRTTIAHKIRMTVSEAIFASDGRRASLASLALLEHLGFMGVSLLSFSRSADSYHLNLIC